MTVVSISDRREVKQTGLFPGITRAEYEAIPAANASMLEHFEQSPAHAREAMIRPRKPSSAMEFGTAFHVAILEPKRFAAEYVAAPKVDRRTNAGKAAWREFEEAHPDHVALDAEEFKTISRMRDAAWGHPIASKLLGGLGLNEVAVVFRDEETGLLCKGLLDRISSFDGWTWIVDAKSTEDASRQAFCRSIKTYHYGAKAAFYLDGCYAVEPRERRFAWIAVEKTPPYGVAIYEADFSAIDAGRSKYRRWLRLYEEAMRTNEWPGYPTHIDPLGSTETEWRG